MRIITDKRIRMNRMQIKWGKREKERRREKEARLILNNEE